MLGHSADGVVACAYVLAEQLDLAGLICESFALEVPASRVTLSELKGLARIAPRLGVFKLKDEYFSRDPAFVEKMKNDPLIPHAGYPAQTIAKLVRTDDRLQTELKRITIPVLIVHGAEDHVTLPSGSKHFAEIAGSKDKTLTICQGHFHDVLNEVGKERVLGDMIKWLNAHLVDGVSAKERIAEVLRDLGLVEVHDVLSAARGGPDEDHATKDRRPLLRHDLRDHAAERVAQHIAGW
ncbi:MAG: Lysophospholipase [Myxococcales bacterium]|nr:Lysophospholipase [Myxococcales bacterium]